MGFSIDFKQFSSFVVANTTLSKEFNSFLKDFLYEMASRVMSRVKPKTPVDTGELRRNWELGDIHGKSTDIYIDILNGMEYSSFIEYGHRIVVNNVEVGWYNGRFMLKTSIEEIQKQMPLRYDKEFKLFCIKHGVRI